MRTTLKTSFEQTIQITTDALKTEGFGVLAQIDVKATLKDKIVTLPTRLPRMEA